MSGTLSSALWEVGVFKERASASAGAMWERVERSEDCTAGERTSPASSYSSPRLQLGLYDVGSVGALPPAVERNLISQVLRCGWSRG